MIFPLRRKYTNFRIDLFVFVGFDPLFINERFKCQALPGDQPSTPRPTEHFDLLGNVSKQIFLYVFIHILNLNPKWVHIQHLQKYLVLLRNVFLMHYPI